MARRTPVCLIVLLAAGCSGGPTVTMSGGTPAVSGSPRVTAGSATPGATARPQPTASPTGAAFRYVFPVAARPVSYHRTHAGYPATDIFAACGSPVRAATDGRILEVSRVDRFDPDRPDGALKGGKFVSLLGDDGVRYYGSHLIEVAAGIDAGMRVRAGQQLGVVGHTGDASNVCHLHFGISPPCARTGDWWVRRGVVWPWSYLDAWRRGGSRSPVDAVAGWRREHGCPSRPPA